MPEKALPWKDTATGWLYQPPESGGREGAAVAVGEGQAQFVGAVRIRFEQFVLFDDAAKGVGRDLGTSEQAFFYGQSVESGTRRGFAVDLG